MVRSFPSSAAKLFRFELDIPSMIPSYSDRDAEGEVRYRSNDFCRVRLDAPDPSA